MGKTRGCLGLQNFLFLSPNFVSSPDGLVPVVTEGRSEAARPVDHDWLGCGGSEPLSPEKDRPGARMNPSTKVRHWELWLALPCSTGSPGQNIPRIVLSFRCGEYLWWNTLKCPLSPVWPCDGGSRRCTPGCHTPSTALGLPCKKAVSADPLPPKQETCPL